MIGNGHPATFWLQRNSSEQKPKHRPHSDCCACEAPPCVWSSDCHCTLRGIFVCATINTIPCVFMNDGHLDG